MTYVMQDQAYWHFIDQLGMSHIELIIYINQTFSLRGTVTQLHVVKI